MLIFRASTVWMAIDAEVVAEIRGREPSTPVPLAPPHVVGMINLRGHAVPLIDLARFLGLPPSGDEASQREEIGGFFDRTVIVSVAGMRVGMLCDQARGIAPLPESEMRAVEVIQGERLREFAVAETSRDGDVLLVLNLERLLQAARVAE